MNQCVDNNDKQDPQKQEYKFLIKANWSVWIMWPMTKHSLKILSEVHY